MNDFSKENDLDRSQGDLRALGHPQRPWQAQPWGVHQVPFIFIKWSFETCFMNEFWKENDLDWSHGDLRALGRPQRPRQAQPWGVQQVPFIFIKMNIWNILNERFLKRKRSGWVPRWSEGSRTPSATSTSSTMGSTASTIYIHKIEHLKYVSWTIFENKTTWMGPKVIWGL